MRVIAIATGYGGLGGHQLREPGDVFEIEDEIAKVSLARPGGTWFKPFKDDKPTQGSRQQKADDLA